MANNGNLKKGNPETQFHKGRGNGRGAVENGEKSGEVRRAKRDFQKMFMQAMELQADPKVAASMEKTGVPIETNYDVMIAGIVKGVIKSNPQMAQRAMELLGADAKTQLKKEMHELEKAKTQLEIERQELENERQRIYLEAIKTQQGQTEELPDDGFIDALNTTALEDWDDD